MKSKLLDCEDLAKKDGFLNKDGTLNRKGYRAMMRMLCSSCISRSSLGYGMFLQSRTRSNYKS